MGLYTTESVISDDRSLKGRWPEGEMLEHNEGVASGKGFEAFGGVNLKMRGPEECGRCG